MMQKFIVTSAAVVLNDQNRILLKQDPKRGWELPGGQVEQDETIKNACVREVKEETGIDIEI
ncbi:NUDIX hydrolase [Sutcliffiella cohnii]|nr:NUDIX hydrolase [Sutcliffiella cohnii]